MLYLLATNLDLPPNILAEIFSMQKEANLLIKQSQGLTQKFVDEWNSRWIEEIRKKEKVRTDSNNVVFVHRRKVRK